MVKLDQINDKEYRKYHHYSEMVSTIFELCPDAISLTKVSDGEIIDCNPEYLNQIGYSREEVIGHTSLELELFNFNERQLFVNEIRKKQTISDFEIQVKRKDNVLINVLYSARFITVNGIQTILSIGKDITERKQIEDELQTTFKRFYSILANLYGSVLLVSNTNKVEFVNQAFCDYFRVNESPDELIGLNNEEMIKKIINNFPHPKQYILHIKEIVELGKPVKEEEIDLLDNRTCIRDFIPIYVNNKSYGRIWHHMDITLLKKAEKRNKKLLQKEQQLTEELTVSNEELQTTTEELQVTNEELRNQGNELIIVNQRINEVLGSILDSFYMLDNDWNFIYINYKAAESVNKEPKELIGQNIWKIFPNYLGTIIEKNYRKAMKNKDTIRFESYGQYSDSWYMLTISPTIEGITVLSTDITDRKKAEEALKESKENYTNLFERMNEGFVIAEMIYDDDGIPFDFRWIEMNHSYEKIIGFTHDKLLGKRARTIFPKLQLKLIENFGKVMLTGKQLQFENYNIDLDKWFEVIAYKITKKHFAFLSLDITERKKAEETLRITMDELKQSNKELEQFAYITSHDLREPLRMITSFLQLLERRYQDQLDKDANEFIGFAVDGAKRLDAMTNDLLQYSKINHEKRDVIPVNFEHVLEHALTNLKVQIEENNAIITHDQLPTINGDEQLKIQLFQNIIGNAIKYRSQKPPKIHICATKEKDQYLFSIKDNGIGMSPEHLEQIFTIFKRLHTHEEYQGTGIGLAIAQKIVHQQGGQIWAESELGKGTTFYFTILIN